MSELEDSDVNRGFDLEDAAVDGAMGVVALIAMAVVAAIAGFIISFIFGLCTEVARIYLAHASTGSRSARVLWAAAAGLVLVWSVATLLVTSTDYQLTGLLLASYGLLAFVIVIEGCDLLGAQQAEQEISAAGQLDTYLEPFAGPTPSTNGHVQMPLGAMR